MLEPAHLDTEPLTDHQIAESFVFIELDLTETFIPSIESCDDIFVQESQEPLFIEAPEFLVESLRDQQPVESPNPKQLESAENFIPSIERSEDILVEVLPFEEALFVKAPDCYVESLIDHQPIESPKLIEVELTEDSVPILETSEVVVQEPSLQVTGSADEIKRPTEKTELLIIEVLEEIRPQLELTPNRGQTPLVENVYVPPPQVPENVRKGSINRSDEAPHLPEKTGNGHGIFSRMCENSTLLAKVKGFLTHTAAKEPKIDDSKDAEGGKKNSLTWETLNDFLEVDDSTIDDQFDEICEESDIPLQPLSQTEPDLVLFKELVENDSSNTREDDEQTRVPVQLEPELAELKTFDTVSLKMKWGKLLVKCKCNRPEHVFFHLPDSEDGQEQEDTKPAKTTESVGEAVEETAVQKGKKRKIGVDGEEEERLLEQETGTHVKFLGAKKRKIHQPDPVPAQESTEVAEVLKVPAVCAPQSESVAVLEQLSSKQSEAREITSHSPDVHKLEEVTRGVCHSEYAESEGEFVSQSPVSEAHVMDDPANDSGFHEPKALKDWEFLDAVGDKKSRSEELDLDTESTSTAFSDLFPRSGEESEVDEELLKKEKVEAVQPKIESHPQPPPKVEPQSQPGRASRLISFFNQLSGRATSVLQSGAGKTLIDSTGSRKSGQPDIQPQVKEQKPEETIRKSADTSVPPQVTEEKPEPEPRLNFVTRFEEISNKATDSPIITQENESKEEQNKNSHSLSRIVAQLEGAINTSSCKVAADSQEQMAEVMSKSEPSTHNPLALKFEEAINKSHNKSTDVDPEVKAEKWGKFRYLSPVSATGEKESVGAVVEGDGFHTNKVTVPLQSSEVIACENYGQEVECTCKFCRSVEYSQCRCKLDEIYETELVVPVRCACGHETLLTELLVSAICPCGQEHTEESSDCALRFKVVDLSNQYAQSTECYCGQCACEDEDEFFECSECQCEHHQCPETVGLHPERYECEEMFDEEDAQEQSSVCSCEHHEDEEELNEHCGQVECTGTAECACEHCDCFQQCEQPCQHAECLCEHYDAHHHSEKCFQENDRHEHQEWAESEQKQSSLASQRKSALSVKFLLRVKKHCKCRTESAGVHLSSSSCTVKKHPSIQRVAHSFAVTKQSSLDADEKKVTM